MSRSHYRQIGIAYPSTVTLIICTYAPGRHRPWRHQLASFVGSHIAYVANLPRDNPRSQRACEHTNYKIVVCHRWWDLQFLALVVIILTEVVYAESFF